MENWQAPMAVARIYAYYILANQRGELEQVMGHIDAFATVNQAERQAKETEWIFMVRRKRCHLCKHIKSDGWDRMCSIEMYKYIHFKKRKINCSDADPFFFVSL
jgi:hypothetical protein